MQCQMRWPRHSLTVEVAMSDLLVMENICKSFMGVPALSDVKLNVRSGEVHAILGENGAGKSTLIKILGGVYSKDKGDIYINGEKADIYDVESSRSYGVSVIHQELMLIPHMTIYENIFLGREVKRRSGTVKHLHMMEEAQKFIDDFGMDFKADSLLGSLTIAQQQMVEIIRAVSFGAKIIVMDEPTSSLSEKEVERLFETVRELKKKGVGIIYISHRMSELEEIADRVTVLRDGTYIGSFDVKTTSQKELINQMVGRELTEYYTKTSMYQEEIVLRAAGLGAGKAVKRVDFELHKGEILGFSGLVGAGRSETMECIFGLRKKTAGQIFVEGKPVEIKNPKDAMKLGIGMVAEDRKKEGLFPNQSVRFNTTIVTLDAFLRKGIYSRRREVEITEDYIQKMQTKVSGQQQLISKLSGGNQQKIIISRWLLATDKILILDEPTRGVDVKTKAEIYHIINDLAIQGYSIIMVSSELPELINMCDRIVVMSHGYTAGILNRNEFSQERIMEFATKDCSLEEV